jgi:hypothetical protein
MSRDLLINADIFLLALALALASPLLLIHKIVDVNRVLELMLSLLRGGICHHHLQVVCYKPLHV